MITNTMHAMNNITASRSYNEEISITCIYSSTAY